MVRAIQVGVGRWGSDWAEFVLPRVKAVEMVAYVDAAPEARARLQTILGDKAAPIFASLEEAAKAVEADLVIATLRTEAHHPVVRQALEMDFNVIVEKPFASTIEQAKDLVVLAEERRRILMVSQNYRFLPAAILASELVGAQKLGGVDLVSIDFRRHAPTQGYKYWDFPNPLLADMSIHHFDLMRMVLGDDPLQVSCRTWNPPGSPFAHHPIGVATIEFTRGTIVSYRGSWMSGGEPTPWSGIWTMDCAQGQIRWTARDHFLGIRKPDQLTIRLNDGTLEEPELPPLELEDRAGALNAIATAIETGSVPPRFSSGRDNLMSFGLVQACITSADRQGEWVEMAEVLG